MVTSQAVYEELSCLRPDLFPPKCRSPQGFRLVRPLNQVSVVVFEGQATVLVQQTVTLRWEVALEEPDCFERVIRRVEACLAE
jgi:hypothetical protein